MNLKEQSSLPTPKAKEKKDTDVLIKCKSVYYRVPARELLFVEVRGHYLVYHLLDGEITALGQLNAIEAQLAARGFFECGLCTVSHGIALL